jgi:large subunit ribosomal protein L4
MNAKARMKALCGALTARAQDGQVVIVDAPTLDAPKTKTLADLITTIGLQDKKVLWVFDKLEPNAWKSARNLARVEATESRTLHTYALMNCDCLVLTEDGLKSLAERVNASERVNS